MASATPPNLAPTDRRPDAHHGPAAATAAHNGPGTFSIFSPVITVEHRAFYERIVSQLNGIFPICTQGKCTAVEVSEDPTEQQQITDLMARVESFSGELLEVTKLLFDQFYQAKEHFWRMIHGTTAYVKINLMDRNLLERTCDVRWWALETAFGEALQLTRLVQNRLAGLRRSLPDGPAAAGLDAAMTAVPRWETAAPASERLRAALRAAAAAHPETRGEAETLAADVEHVLARTGFACDRLEDINTSYSLYRDLVLVSDDGTVLANSNKTTRARVLGLNVAAENWFRQALATKDGTQYHAEDLRRSQVEAAEPLSGEIAGGQPASLVYSTAVRENTDNYGRVIGAMGVFFDFQDEARLILEDHLPRDPSGFVEDGWYAFFTDAAGTVIASSDPGVIVPGTVPHIPRRHRTPAVGHPPASFLVIEGRESALYSSRTDGYLDYPGLGWSSHLVVPKECIFRTEAGGGQLGLSLDDLMQSRLVPEINKQTFAKVQDDKESIQLISLNGIVFASKLGKAGVALGPIFDQIKETGESTTAKMEDLLRQMAVGEYRLNLQALENFSKQAIDLLDRNLFERAADVRWWSTDRFFWTALQEPTPENFQKAAHRMEVINGSYTMYRNLVLADRSGEIVASARGEDRHKLKAYSASDDPWYMMAMRTTRSSEYAVQDVTKSELEPRKVRSLVYAGGVRRDGRRQGDPIGVVGILFDWDTEARKILMTCLPKGRDGELVEGCAAFYVNADHQIIESTDPEQFRVGASVRFPVGHATLKAGQSASGLFQSEGRRYILGSSRTKGYREYQGLGWSAHVVRPI